MPLKKETIRVERFTSTDIKNAGRQKSQVVASGDESDPGVYLYVGKVRDSEKLGFSYPGQLVDVQISRKTGEILPGKGLWKRLTE